MFSGCTTKVQLENRTPNIYNTTVLIPTWICGVLFFTAPIVCHAPYYNSITIVWQPNGELKFQKSMYLLCKSFGRQGKGGMGGEAISWVAGFKAQFCISGLCGSTLHITPCKTHRLNCPLLTFCVLLCLWRRNWNVQQSSAVFLFCVLEHNSLFCPLAEYFWAKEESEPQKCVIFPCKIVHKEELVNKMDSRCDKNIYPEMSWQDSIFWTLFFFMMFWWDPQSIAQMFKHWWIWLKYIVISVYGNICIIARVLLNPSTYW